MNYIESVVPTATSYDSPTMPAACVLPMFLTTILKSPCHEETYHQLRKVYKMRNWNGLSCVTNWD